MIFLLVFLTAETSDLILEFPSDSITSIRDFVEDISAAKGLARSSVFMGETTGAVCA
jgi:hypothetical protein